MKRLILFSMLLLVLPAAATATVEIAIAGRAPTQIGEVYLRDGISYLAIDDLLAPLGLKGRWDAVDHVYRIATPAGSAILSPGSHYLRLGDRAIPLEHKPRFIDGRLRVAEEVAILHLGRLAQQPVDYRNLNPGQGQTAAKAAPLDQLFAFLLQKKAAPGAAPLRGVAIDPGHGGEDPGVIGKDGSKEKELVLGQARRLEKLLKMQLGIPVYLSRDGDYTLSAQQRFDVATRPDVGLLIQLHAQNSYAPAARGVTLFVRPLDEASSGVVVGEGPSMALARRLEAALRDEAIPVLGIVRAPLLPLGRGNLPTVLIELGFLSGDSDLLRLKQDEAQERIAQALLKGIKSFNSEQN
ncbi:MAG: hypothetical protein A2091_00460 [Desulfuromonadales bacterium GWD2_61_12]|nr:MAG: hypothetical protein A2005_08485 [Desulfuromonadales bacterium GWC2_61_20]OGR32738.1 MAG: hypothetical protein A2091_00460 [Desulfuromonadales bacterium GWD2_61_12]